MTLPSDLQYIRVLVCGGRDYPHQDRVVAVLDEIHRTHTITLIIEGGASGADRFARMWAQQRGVPICTMEAKWDVLGKNAGPIRNQHMLIKKRPDLVVAFPGGYGTADMTRRAARARIPLQHELT